jgi:L-histidine N-alpha-methyltransferase
MLVHAIPSNATYDFATDVRAGLTRTGQKELPSKYLYDDVGSALFEVISRLAARSVVPSPAHIILSGRNIPFRSGDVRTRTERH